MVRSSQLTVLIALALLAAACQGEQSDGGSTVGLSEPTATGTPATSGTLALNPTATPLGPAVTIGGVTFEAEVAATRTARAKGLSGRDILEPQTGMLFVFESGRTSAFWMRQMRFPLDFIWVGEECKVVDLTLNIPPPESGIPDSELPRYKSSVSAAYTFEINAGEVERFGIRKGAAVSFSRLSTIGANC